MNILKALTAKNVKILELIDKEKLHIREVADRLKISPGTVHKLVQTLKKEKLIIEKQHKNKKIIELNKNNFLTRELKRIINLNKIINIPAYKKLRKYGKTGIYGSFANGTNDSESDLDIWVEAEKKEGELRPLIKELEKQAGVKVNLLILAKAKIEMLQKNNPEFFLRLKLTSIGDYID